MTMYQGQSKEAYINGNMLLSEKPGNMDASGDKAVEFTVK